MLERLYGIHFEETKSNSDGVDEARSSNSSLLVALQHRAALFGILGASLFVGSFYHRPSLPLAIGMTIASDVSFLAIAVPKWNSMNAKMKRVVVADILSILCLVLGYPQVS